MNLFDDLIAFYPMTEGAGTTITALNSTVTNPITGTFYGTHQPTWASTFGWNGGSNLPGLQFAGYGDGSSGKPGSYVILDVYPAEAYMPRLGFSVSLWVSIVTGDSKIRTIAGKSWISATDHSEQGRPPWVIYKSATDHIVFTAYPNPDLGPWYSITSGSAVSSGVHHIALTWDGTTWTLYVDGVSVGTPVAANIYGSNASPPNYLTTQLGGAIAPASGTPNDFNGAIGPVGFWGRGLTASEVLTLANAITLVPTVYRVAPFSPSVGSTAAQLSDLWALNTTLVALVGARTWAYATKVGAGETIMTAVNRIVTAGYGDTAPHRAALLIPNGTYNVDGAGDGYYVNLNQTGMHFIDLIGESRTGVILQTATAHDVGGSTGCPVIDNGTTNSLLANMTLIRNASALARYCLHDDAALLNSERVHLNLQMYSRNAAWTCVGSRAFAGEKHWNICCDADRGYYLNNASSQAAACENHLINCTSGQQPFSPQTPAGYPLYGLDYNNNNSGQSDLLVIRGCNLRGITNDILVESSSGDHETILKLDSTNQDGRTNHNSILSGTVVYDSIGGVIPIMVPINRASELFALTDPGYSANTSTNLAAGVTVDDVSGDGAIGAGGIGPFPLSGTEAIGPYPVSTKSLGPFPVG